MECFRVRGFQPNLPTSVEFDRQIQVYQQKSPLIFRIKCTSKKKSTGIQNQVYQQKKSTAIQNQVHQQRIPLIFRLGTLVSAVWNGITWRHN
jgi:hypothetical protein